MEGKIVIDITSIHQSDQGKNGIEIKVAVDIQRMNSDLSGPIINALCNALRLSTLRRSLLLSEIASGKYDPKKHLIISTKPPSRGDHREC